MNRCLLLILLGVFGTLRGETPSGGSVVQTIPLDATRPYFVPTHARVTTTVRFPAEIGAPEGSVAVFTDDAKQPAEYLVNWQQGDAYFTVTPLQEPELANLNVPYHGRTYVFYLYPVQSQMQALAAVCLVDSSAVDPSSTAASDAPKTKPPEVVRLTSPPPHPTTNATAARLLGFVDRLKVLHAAPTLPVLAAAAQAMGVQVAVAEGSLALAGQPNGSAAFLTSFALNDAGLYHVILLRCVRDPRLNCLGFVCLLRNVSDQVLAFDVSSFGVRVGNEFLRQRISDAPAILKPGEQSPAYFVVEPRRTDPLLPTNDWRVTVELVSPRVNPGAAIARAFAPRTEDP